MSDSIDIEDLRSDVRRHQPRRATEPPRRDAPDPSRRRLHRPPRISDDIDDTVNYRTLTKAIIHEVEENRFKLVEHLAERVAGLCLAFDPRIERVGVTVRKPGAPAVRPDRSPA